MAYCYDGDEDLKVLRAWEQEFKLNLEVDYFKKWIQKDVNNYIAVTESDYVLVKGGDVNKYHQDRFFANNDIRITHIALVDYLIHGKPVQDTLIENVDKPILYQYVLQAGSTYQGVVMYDQPDKLLNTKINRVFATDDGGQIVKKREDGGLVKFADTPDKMYVYNGDLEEFEEFKEIIDLQWYYDLTIKNLKRWQ